MMVKKYLLLIVGIVLVSFVFSGGVSAKDLYVSPTGTASWNECTNINTPCPAQTAMQNAIAGDTVYFRGGTYQTVNEPFRPTNSGTSGNPITFVAYPGEIVTLHNSGTDNQAVNINQNYIIFDGFIISASNPARCGPELYLVGAYITIRNSHMVGHGWPGGTNCAALYIPRSGCDNCLFQNNLITDYYANDGSVNTCGIMLYGSDNVVIENNNFINCEKGMYIKEGNNGLHIRNNFFNDCRSGPSIYVLGSVYQRNIDIYQNIVINGGFYGILLYGYSGDVENINIYNNVIHNNGQGVSWPTTDNVQNIQAWNNIYSTNRGDRVTRNEKLTYQNFNDFYANNRISDNAITLAEWQQQTQWDDNSIDSNPLFVNDEGSSPEDYKLQLGSPALTLGTDRQDYDNDGNTAERIPAGAYITGDEIIGYTPFTISDTLPPLLSNPQPTTNLSSGTTQTTISLSTNEVANCKYSTTAGISYTSMSNTFSNTDSTTVTGLSDGNTYYYYIRCQDTLGNYNTNDFVISFSVNEQQVCTDNDGDNYYAESGCGTLIDCDDNNPNINPGATEICDNGIDDDCDNLIDCNDNDCIGASNCQTQGTITVEFGDAANTDYPGTVEDTFIDVGTVDQNYLNDTHLNTYTWPVNTAANAIIIKWDLSAIPTTATITDATLQLYMDSMEDGGGDSIYDIAAHKITGVNPDPATCTWNTPWTSPGGQSDIALPEDTNSMDKTLGYKSWSVTDMVQDWVPSPGENYGMLVNSDSSASVDSNRLFSSSDSTSIDQRPKLVITYSTSQTYHRADTNPQNGCIDTQEILAFISLWHYDSTAYPMSEMMEGVALWKAGTGCS